MPDNTLRQQLDQTHQFLLECGNQRTGRNFFEALARYLAGALDMDYVCIDRLEGDGLSARTVAVYFDGAFQDNVTYALKDTPCGDVVGKRICCFPSGVRHLFPRDEALQQIGGDSYLGTTLWSYDGKPIGLIAVIGRRPLADTSRAVALLNLVALRAAGEMERLQAEDTQRRLLESTSSLTGAAFFDTLVRELAQWTTMRFALIAEVDPSDASRAIPRAFWDGSHLAAMQPFDIKGTPSAKVIAERFGFGTDWTAEFGDDDPVRRRYNLVSYAGVGLYDPDHAPIGMLAAFHDRPLASLPANAKEILALFGQRAAAELLRLRDAKTLERHAAELQAFNEALVGRETRVIELKAEVNRLAAELGREAPYPPIWEAE